MVAKSRKTREEQKLIFLEGQSLICDAVAAGAQIKALYFSAIEHLAKLPMDVLQEIPLYKVTLHHMKIWSDVERPPGLLGEI